MVLQFPSLLQGLPDPESQEAHLQSRLPRNHLPQNHPLPRSRPLPRNRLPRSRPLPQSHPLRNRRLLHNHLHRSHLLPQSRLLPQSHPLPRSRPLPRNHPLPRSRPLPRIHLLGIHSTLHRIPLLLPHLPPGIHLQNHLRQNRLRRIHLPLQNHRLRNYLPNHPGFLFPEFLHLLVLLRFLLQRRLHLLLQTLRPHPQSLRLQTLPLRNHLHPQNPRPPSLLPKLLQQSLLQVLLQTLQVLPQYRPALLLK